MESLPKKTAYHNGAFKVGGATNAFFDSYANEIPKRHIFGGQLQKLKYSLSNPLEQFTGIVFIGDSITWGRTLVENSAFDPRDGTLSDPRDNFFSPSFVNEFKRYIGSQYAGGGNPILSNWPTSPSGEALVEYTTQHILYPKDGDFTLTSVGPLIAADEVKTVASISGYQHRLSDGNVNGTSYQSITFNFTGDSFTLSFGCLESNATYYNLYVDGVLQGTYSTHAGIDGFVDNTSDNRRTHTFPYVRNKQIEIRTNRNGENTGNRRLRLEGIIIDKKIRITNQGINGTSAKKYVANILLGNTSGDGEALRTEDNYVFVQLGTNDRLIEKNKPKGQNEFKSSLKSLLDKVTPLSDVILMCANPVTKEETNVYSFSMQQARDVIYSIAKENGLDMIDNFTIFDGIDMSAVTTDGIHPNTVGHKIIAMEYYQFHRNDTIGEYCNMRHLSSQSLYHYESG